MKFLRKIAIVFAIFFAAIPMSADVGKLKVALIGMVHGHVKVFLNADYSESVDLVGIYEPNVEVVAKYRDQYDLEENLFFDDLEAMLAAAKPEAAWVFSSTFDHEMAVAACAAQGVDVIVEKPLAVDYESASRMAALARESEIQLLTNLETTWHPSVQRAIAAVESGELGPITKIVSHYGHNGPVEIGCSPEFLEWLTDPVLNGGGASTDFGCYGANIITHMMKGRKPLAVTAIFQTHKPEIYPRVDDDATIILEYPGAQAIIQASWNWPYSRKDIHLYGRSGVLRTINTVYYDVREGRWGSPLRQKAELEPLYSDPIAYYAAVLRGQIDPEGSLSCLSTNLIAVEIMDAAKWSAENGKRYVFPSED